MGTPNWQNQTIWTGDNLDIMRGMNSESVDLIYLDPPFNSNRDYAAPIGSQAAGAAFKDTWTLSDVDEAWHGEIAEHDPALYGIIDAAGQAHGKGMKSYLIMMAVRLLEMRRVLRDTGSLYLHCDPMASHYLKILMDAIFGKNNFRNEIIWKRTSSKKATKKLGAVHDVILFYSASNENVFNPVYGDHNENYVQKFYRFEDQHGRFRTGDLTAAGVRYGDSGEPWRGIDVTVKGNHWRGPGTFPDHVEKPDNWGTMKTREKLDYLDSVGLIYWPPKGDMPAFKRYLNTSQGSPMTDVIVDVSPLSAKSKEKVGYPTQKPFDLLERLIQTSSNHGDIIMDPFCGCATACVASQLNNRQWVGIDISSKAFDLVKVQLDKKAPFFNKNVIHRTDIPQRTDQGPVVSYKTHKHTLFGKQEGVCNGCRHSFQFRNFTIDHKVSQAKGGTDHLDNLQLLCGACNSMKGAGTQEALIAKLKQEGIR